MPNGPAPSPRRGTARFFRLLLPCAALFAILFTVIKMKTKTADHNDLYAALYRLFEGVTPLNADCGEVCGARCCAGDEAVGMLLFPQEPTVLPVTQAGGRRYVLCSGSCLREQRPLSCRIFPLFPAADEKGHIRAVPDARGAGVCPLVRQYENVRFDPRFVRRVRKAGRLLAKDAECLAFLREITSEIGEAEHLRLLLEESIPHAIP